MIVVVSPYHLVSREAPALASLLLADQVVTLLPAPLGAGSAAARQAAARSPWYARFVDALAWTAPLWREGVLAKHLGEEDPGADMREVVDRIRDEPALLALRPLIREALFESEHTYLSALGSDLTRGGPDPAITSPLAAALDRFARRHRAAVARPQPVSVVQRAEASLGTPALGIALPLFVQATGDHLLLAREILGPELAVLRRLLERITLAVTRGESPEPIARELPGAGAAYAHAFESHARDLAHAPDDEVRPVVASVVITAQAMPVEAVLRSSIVAMGSLVGASRSAVPAPAGLTVGGADVGPFLSLTFKPMGQSRAGRSLT